MINAIIIEDEKPALENLVSTLSVIASDVQVAAPPQQRKRKY
ncbi:MAG: hypothetical protein WDO71_13265 [Bacteroidota bacterium]